MPVDGRFEHIVLSCNATSDHAIIWIQREAQRAMDVSPPFLIYLFSTCLNYFMGENESKIRIRILLFVSQPDLSQILLYYLFVYLSIEVA